MGAKKKEKEKKTSFRHFSLTPSSSSTFFRSLPPPPALSLALSHLSLLSIPSLHPRRPRDDPEHAPSQHRDGHGTPKHLGRGEDGHAYAHRRVRERTLLPERDRQGDRCARDEAHRGRVEARQCPAVDLEVSEGGPPREEAVEEHDPGGVEAEPCEKGPEDGVHAAVLLVARPGAGDGAEEGGEVEERARKSFF